MEVFLTVLHLLACFVLIVVVLLQRGKGADMGAMFGGGASATVFGSRGAGNFFTKLTTAAVITFFVTSLSFNYLLNTESGGGFMQDEASEVEEAEPDQDAPLFEEVGEAATGETEPAEEAQAPADEESTDPES
ncbi:MAG: preprotein translocase subunit SecG [Deltaproteobacteria bacterium]|nr:preprotein translocase subunit SecG [Deltaproteobacteria bacterium]